MGWKKTFENSNAVITNWGPRKSCTACNGKGGKDWYDKQTCTWVWLECKSC